MSLCAIDDKTERQLMVIWDLGRRCTFACSYCPPHRKNNWSAVASFDQLVKTADALERYSEIYNKHRNEPFRVAASFTGGEPTVNPAFFKFLEYLQVKYPHWKRTLTTNGFYSDRKLQVVMANTDFTTVSYHCESTPAQKRQVRKNLETMRLANYGFKINIMFHERDDYFKECVALAQWCDDNNVKYTPRVIGDQGDVEQGLKDRTVHTYTLEQIDWMNRFWSAKKQNQSKPAYVASDMAGLPTPSKPATDKVVGQSIGRPCCGGRKMDLLNNDEWSVNTFVTNNNFQGWSCMINWYFLYIHQEIDRIWHHQTCQVNLDGKIGHICKASEFDQFCDQLEDKFSTGNIPFIRCPKTHCGCGLCVPKAKNDQLAREIFGRHAPGVTPDFMQMQSEIDYSGTLKNTVYAYDKENGNETI
jgi:organic radical activating enzyme